MCAILEQLKFQELDLPDIFQKIRNPIKSQIGRQVAWKLSQLKGRDCFTAVIKFNSISQAVYKL